ncbi:P-loop NTPase [Candidatus Bathyarchaeota archaeon]|nr:P-loop NTPase [Candidatus Bathyarchaeota archaeon]
MSLKNSAITKRLEDIERIIAIVSGKGGVGKTLIASTMALTMAKFGFPSGLLDMDFTNSSCHLILGVDVLKEKPVEDMGVLPVKVHGIEFMSVAFYSRGEALPLRGMEVDNVFRELLMITRWGRLKALVIDTPSGFGDVILNIATYLPRAEFIAVTSPNRLSLEALKRLAGTYMRERVLGVIVNMSYKPIHSSVERMGFKVLVEIPRYDDLEDYMGYVDRLMETEFAGKIEETVLKVLDESFKAGYNGLT